MSKEANAIIEAETSCLKITCCNNGCFKKKYVVPELACLSASSPPSCFQSCLTGRKPPSSFKSSLTGRRRRASRHRLADYRGHLGDTVALEVALKVVASGGVTYHVWRQSRITSILVTYQVNLSHVSRRPL